MDHLAQRVRCYGGRVSEAAYTANERDVAPPAETALKQPVVLRAEHVDKVFQLQHDSVHTLKQRIIKPGRRTFERLDALRDVSFEVHRGEFFGIVGRNGSGKSTLLKCIAGIYSPSSGVISAAGSMSTFIELGVGFNPELNARDNVVINGALLGLPGQVIHRKFDEIVAFAELEEFVDMKLKNYSSGMQVRLAFSVAIHAEAEILLLDEVLAVGDASFQRKCFDTFERLRGEGKTVILVTHDMSMVERFCSRAMMLERGAIVSLGDPVTVGRDYVQINVSRDTGLDAGTDRWGDQSAEILESWFENPAGKRREALDQSESAVFKMRVRFNSAHTGPIFGLSLRDEQKRTAFASNTLWDGITTGSFAAGDEVVYELTFENYLADGRYFASPAVAHADAIAIADWREHMTSVLVHGKRRTGGHVDLPHTSGVTRVKANVEHE